MSVVLGHPTRITEGQLQDLFLLYCNEREVKVVAGSTGDYLYITHCIPENNTSLSSRNPNPFRPLLLSSILPP